MRKQPAAGAIERSPATLVTNTTGTITVLSVSPLEEDNLSLRSAIGHTKWMLVEAHDLVSTLALLHRHDVAVVLCERDLLPGTWIDVWEHIKALSNAPSLIVTSRLADERLWAEALNLGAWDVLAKPFDRSEVIRAVASGWRHWYDHVQMTAGAVKIMAAAN